VAGAVRLARADALGRAAVPSYLAGEAAS